MKSLNEISEPRLAPPGAGLPFAEWAVAKYILLPQRFRAYSTQTALEAFAADSRRLLEIANLSPATLSERRLIPRLQGLEDSSRFWSIAMTLEHLIIVGNLMRQSIIHLSNGKTSTQSVSTAQVKPPLDTDAANIVEEFRKMSLQFVEAVSRCDVDAYPKATNKHPWFGPLNAKQWLVMAVLHQQVHKRQVSAIKKLLPPGGDKQSA